MMFFKKKTFKLKIKDYTFVFRKITEFDLLDTSYFIPIFILKKDEKKDEIESLIKNHEDRLKESDKKDDYQYKKQIIDKCLLKIYGSKDEKLLNHILNNNDMIDICYLSIISNSLSRIYYVSEDKAEEIFLVYKGTNYAHNYFGKNVLTKLEEYSFNRLINSVGINMMNKLQKESLKNARIN